MTKYTYFCVLVVTIWTGWLVEHGPFWEACSRCTGQEIPTRSLDIQCQTFLFLYCFQSNLTSWCKLGLSVPLIGFVNNRRVYAVLEQINKERVWRVQYLFHSCFDPVVFGRRLVTVFCQKETSRCVKPPKPVSYSAFLAAEQMKTVRTVSSYRLK